MTTRIPTSTESANPYVGPRPFERNDSGRFFGRDQEASELLSLIVANRIVVLYAPSGAGKTSLLNAQVVSMLEDEDFEVWPFARLRGPVLETIDPDDIYNIYTFYTLLSWAGDDADPTQLSQQTLTDYLDARPHSEDEFGYEKPRLLIFDQFEEIFTAYPARWFEREGFFNHIQRALDDDPLLRVVFSLREDYVAQLDPYAPILHRNLRTRFRLERMRPEASLDAIRGPLNQTHRVFADDVAEKLVEDLRQVRVETMSGETETVEGQYIEPVQLQVVCQNLWEDLPDDVTTITHAHLQQFGNIDQALAAFYTRAVERAQPKSGLNEGDVRQWFEKSLITPAGTRGTVYRGTNQTGGMDNTAIDQLEDMHIIRGEWRAGARWYELTHDRLIDPIQKANRQWHEERAAARIRRIRNVAVGTAVLLAVSILCWFTSIFIANSIVQTQNAMESTAIAEIEAGVPEKTAVFLEEIATAQSEINIEYTATAVVRAIADEQATATSIAREVQDAEFEALAQASTATVIAQATQNVHATATAEARAIIDAQATQTAQALERILQPVRPLQPGVSIGAAGLSNVGTLSAFVQDSEGNSYLLGPRAVINTADTLILQPSPIDGGKEENAIALTTPRLGPGLADALGAVINASELIELAQLQPGMEFRTIVPGIGAITGTAEPRTNRPVRIIGRTSGIVDTMLLDCPAEGCIIQTRAAGFTAPYTLADTLAPGDEGALVVNFNNMAVGIVAHIGTEKALVVPIETVLEENQVSFVNSNYTTTLIESGQFERSVTFKPDGGSRIAAGGSTLRIWDLPIPEATPNVEFSFGDPNQRSLRLLVTRFNPSGDLILTGDDFGNIHVRSADGSNRPELTLEAHEDLIQGIEFIDDDHFVSVSYDEQVRIWRISSNQRIALRHDFTTTHGFVRSVALSPDHSLMVTGHQDGSMILWDISDLEAPSQLKTIRGHSINVLSVGFSPDGSNIVSADSIGEVHIRNVEEFPEVADYQWRASRSIIWDVAYSPDGSSIATVGEDALVRFWDAEVPLDRSWTYQGHTNEIRDLEFSGSGRWLATASGDGTVRIWQNPFFIDPNQSN